MLEAENMTNKFEVGDIVYDTIGYGPFCVESSRPIAAVFVTWFDAEGKERLGLKAVRCLTAKRPSARVWLGPSEYPARGEHPDALPSDGPPTEADIEAGRYLVTAERVAVHKAARRNG